MLITDPLIIEEICILKEKGLTMKKISHQLSRTHSNYFKGKRASVNFVPSDILKIFDELRKSGELPKRKGRFR
jgi:hypothetical protein